MAWFTLSRAALFQVMAVCQSAEILSETKMLWVKEPSQQVRWGITASLTPSAQAL